MKRKQRDRVLEYMMKYGSITPAEAFMELSVSSRFGETCTYAKYRLVIESA